MFKPTRLGLLAILSLIILVIHLPGAVTTPLEFSPLSSDHKFAPGKQGAVASESSICSGHGTKILELGGNAADAVSLKPSSKHTNHGVFQILIKVVAHCD